MRFARIALPIAFAAMLVGCPDWGAFTRGSSDAGPAPSEAGAETGAPIVDSGTDSADAAIVPALGIDAVPEDDPVTIDLTAFGTTDWIEIHRANSTGNRCGPCTQAIAPLATNGADLDDFADDPRKFSWSNGKPDVKSGSTGGVLIVDKGSAFEFAVTPNGTRQLFTLHLNTYYTGATITARFDGLASPTATSPLAAAKDGKRYAIRIHFTGPPTSKLAVDFTETEVIEPPDPTDVPNIAFSAATLAPEP